jgi:hypothetical protein
MFTPTTLSTKKVVCDGWMYVQPSVAVRGAGKLALAAEDELPVGGEARDERLLKDEHVVGVEPEVSVGLEEGFGALLGRIRCHDVPKRLTCQQTNTSTYKQTSKRKKNEMEQKQE